MKEVVMKSIRRYVLLPVILCSFAFVLTSCEEVNIGFEIGNNTNSYREATDFLCSRVWIDEWVDDYGSRHRQELRFDYNNLGQDYIMIVDRRGNIQEYTYNFVWDWFNSNYTSLRLKYGYDDYSYMDNMYMRNNMIECLLDGELVRFYGR